MYDDMALREANVINSDSDENLIGAIAHWLTFAGYVCPFGNLIGPLIVFLVKKNDSRFIRANAAEALNFQLSLLIYILISIPLCLILIGIPIIIALVIMDLVCTIVAAIKAHGGEVYRYPMTIRFIS